MNTLLDQYNRLPRMLWALGIEAFAMSLMALAALVIVVLLDVVR